MPYTAVASASSGVDFFSYGGYGYGRRNGCCGNIFGCLCLFVFIGLGCTITGLYYMNAAFVDSRGTNIKTFNSYVDAWEGTAALMSAFTTSVPYSVKFESNASTSLSMDKQETHYDSKKEFGDSGSDLTAGFTSVKFVSGAQSYSADQASEINLSILSKGTDTISGPFSIPQTKLSTWTCNDKADAARGGKCAAGNSCGLDYDQYGCPPSSSTWGPNARYGPQWYYQSSSNRCLNYGNCYCQCTSGNRRGHRYRTRSYNGYNIDCLDAGVITSNCGSFSRAEMNCYYQAPQKRTCSDECNSVQKGKWNSATGDCQVKSALTSVCLVSDKQNNPQLRKLSDTDVSGASPPPNSAGCIWDSKSASFVPTKYTPVTYGSISKQSFNVQLVSGKDPWYLGTLLTKGCNLKTTPSMCFGESPASLGSRGLILLIVGLLILCCPCITWYCFFKEKSGGSTKNYTSATQAASYQPMAQPPQQVQQQGGYMRPPQMISQPVAYAQPTYQQQPVLQPQQQQYVQPQQGMPVAYAQ